MTHGEILPRIDQKLDYIEKYKPQWYKDDEKMIIGVEHRLDDQIKRIEKKSKPKPAPLRFAFRGGPAKEAPGIDAAEKGH